MEIVRLCFSSFSLTLFSRMNSNNPAKTHAHTHVPMVENKMSFDEILFVFSFFCLCYRCYLYYCYSYFGSLTFSSISIWFFVKNFSFVLARFFAKFLGTADGLSFRRKNRFFLLLQIKKRYVLGMYSSFSLCNPNIVSSFPYEIFLQKIKLFLWEMFSFYRL